MSDDFITENEVLRQNTIDEKESLSQEFKRATCWNSDKSRLVALNDFIQLTESSGLPEFLKERFKASADREIESIAFRHADFDLLKDESYK